VLLRRAGRVQLLLNLAAAFTARADTVALELPLLALEAIAVGLQVLLANWPRILRRGVSRERPLGSRVNGPWLRQQRRQPGGRHDDWTGIDRRGQRSWSWCRIDGGPRQRYRTLGLTRRAGGADYHRQQNRLQPASHAVPLPASPVNVAWAAARRAIGTR